MPALYVTEKEVAALIGCSLDWLHSEAKDLEDIHGFPPIDPAIGMRHRGAIIAWSEGRNAPKVIPTDREKNVENNDAF